MNRYTACISKFRRQTLWELLTENPILDFLLGKQFLPAQIAGGWKSPHHRFHSLERKIKVFSHYKYAPPSFPSDADK
jgi:hypothetical protein